jgi:hypothetical protein
VTSPRTWPIRKCSVNAFAIRSSAPFQWPRQRTAATTPTRRTYFASPLPSRSADRPLRTPQRSPAVVSPTQGGHFLGSLQHRGPRHCVRRICQCRLPQTANRTHAAEPSRLLTTLLAREGSACTAATVARTAPLSEVHSEVGAVKGGHEGTFAGEPLNCESTATPSSAPSFTADLADGSGAFRTNDIAEACPEPYSKIRTRGH